MKILLLWPFFHPDNSGIACAIRGEAFAKYLNKKGIDISVFVPQKKNVSKTRIKFEGCTVYRTITYNTLAESYPFYLSALYLPISLLTLIRKVIKIKPDIIIASTPGPFLPIEGLLISKCLKIPFIFDMEDSWHLTKLSHKGAKRNNIKMYLESLCATHADLIFTVTPTLKRIICTGYKIPEDKIKIVYNGIDSNILPKINNICENVDLLHLGSPRIYYDTMKLIDAFYILIKHLPEIRIEFIGCTGEDYVEEVKRYVNEKGLSKNIKFVPPILHEKIPYELARAKIGVISLLNRPEYTSAIGVKVFEYMAAGLPTAYLGPSKSEQEKIIKENNIGISSSDPFEFVEKVISLLGNRELRHIMGTNAKKAVKKYDWEIMIDQAFENHILPLLNE